LDRWIFFLEAEGCFKVTILKKPNNRYQVLLEFQMTQHSKDRNLLNILLTYFGCGMLEKYNRNSVYYFSVYTFLDNYDKNSALKKRFFYRKKSFRF